MGTGSRRGRGCELDIPLRRARIEGPDQRGGCDRDASAGYAETFYLYDFDSLYDSTVDGTHAKPEFYHEWTMNIMEQAEKQLRTGCLGGSGGGGDESEDEGEGPSPTKQPTSSDESEDESDGGRPEPTYQPSSGSTANPSRDPTSRTEWN